MKATTTTQQFKVTNTRYFCEEDGCDFVTSDQQEAEEHPWRKHKTFKKVYLDVSPSEDLRMESTLVWFEAEEEYEAYQKLQHDILRFWVGNWEGPGWYETWTEEVPCGRGCCTDTALIIRSASQTLSTLKEVQENLKETITMLEKMGVDHVVG